MLYKNIFNSIIESQSYVLNFHGRVTRASVKNFQLIECIEDTQTQTTANSCNYSNATKEGQKPLLSTTDINGKKNLYQNNLIIQLIIKTRNLIL